LGSRKKKHDTDNKDRFRGHPDLGKLSIDWEKCGGKLIHPRTRILRSRAYPFLKKPSEEERQ